MKKIVCIGTAITVSGLLLLQAQFGVINRAHAAATAQGENVIVRVLSPREPVEVTKLQVGRKDITFGTSFAGDESWVNALSSEVRNTSGKTMTELRMSASFEAGNANPHRIHIPLTYSEPIQPNQIVHVSAPAANVASLRGLLAKQGITPNFKKGELSLQFAKFQDGSIWVKGVTLGPSDPRTGKRQRVKTP